MRVFNYLLITSLYRVYQCSYLRNAFFILLIITLSNCISFSQQYLFDLQKINVKDGLPARQVFDIAQDKDGFIWISTRMGIHRYDGYSFKTYSCDYLNLPDRNPANIIFDSQNRLWYNTWRFFDRHYIAGVIDINSDSLVSNIQLANQRQTIDSLYGVTAMNSSKQELLLSTKAGILYNFNNRSEEIYRVPQTSKGVYAALRTKKNDYWICKGHKAIKIDNGRIQQEFSLPINDQEFVDRILERNDAPIFEIRTQNALEVLYQTIEGDAFVPFRIKGEQSIKVKKILYIHPTYTVYAKQDSLIVRDTLGNLLFYSEFPDGMPDLRNSFLDAQSNLWIASKNGLFKLSRNENPFTIINKSYGVREIFKDAGYLWLSGNSSNLVKDLETGTYLTKPFPTWPLSFIKDHRGHILIGTKSGILDYTPDSLLKNNVALSSTVMDTRRFKPILEDIVFRSLYQNPITKNYWGIGGRTRDNINEGYVLDLKQNRISHSLLPDTFLDLGIKTSYILQDKEVIWLVTNKGLFQMDALSESLVKHYSIKDGMPFDNFNYIYIDSLGVFWIASHGGGLIRWDRKNNQFKQFTKEEGLSSDYLYAICEDAYGDLWISSDFGLMNFKKKNATIKVYLSENGLAMDEFNTVSHAKDDDGTLYFGGPDGITSFHPSTLQQLKTPSLPLRITKVKILKEGEEKYLDQTSVFLETGKLQMNHLERIMEIDVALLDYISPHQNQFAYRISGYQEQWIYTNNHKISLFGLPYGNYELIVKGRGLSGEWNAIELSIPLSIPPPYYLQTWFILAMILLALAIIWLGVHLRLRSLGKERKLLEKEVEKRTHTIAQQTFELKALDKAKTNFFSSITHEFRTPLTLIIGPLEQVISEQPPPTILRRRLGGIQKNAHHLLNLINQMLDLSKIESGRMQMETTRGDIIIYTQDLIKRFEPLANKKGLRLEFNGFQENWDTYFDKDSWDKIVYNLLSNAIKFTNPGGDILLTLHKEEKNNRDHIQLKVKDSGIGIDKDQISQIFNRFYQADESTTRSQGGTGIGLALVKELVEMQEGQIEVFSEIEKGTTFDIHIPVLDSDKASQLMAEPFTQLTVPSLESLDIPITTASNAISDETSKLELLIIEDNVEMREYIRYCIDASKYNITEASNGEEGIEKAQVLIPDLIISDVMMPKKNGFEVTEAIRNHIGTSHIPLILLTAKASLESRLLGLKRGADAYLTKPFSPQELILRIQKLIDIRQLLQQRYSNHTPPEENKTYLQEDEFIINLRNYILQNIDVPGLNGDHIGKHFGISRVNLYRKLKALTDQPISDFVRNIRLNKAKELIQIGKLTISEISYQTGFSSIQHFSRAFKKAFGQAPSEFKKFN